MCNPTEYLFICLFIFIYNTDIDYEFIPFSPIVEIGLYDEELARTYVRESS